MKLKLLPYDLSACKINEIKTDLLKDDFYFIGKTDEELSLVCETSKIPNNVIKKDMGWRAFKIVGELDFSLIGILAPIADILAKNKIGIFVVSTYNTDYVLVKKENIEKTVEVLKQAGYTFE